MKIYALLHHGNPVSFAHTEHGAWDQGAVKARLFNWWAVNWNDDSIKEIIRRQGFDVKPATVTIDGETQ
jgi:hypothetical protein